MQKEQSFFAAFFIFSVLSIFIFFLSTVGVLTFPQHLVQIAFSPLQKIVYSAVASSKNNTSPILEENRKLVQELAGLEKLQKENAALRDQFQTSEIKSSTLLPATVVGSPGFLPGISSVESLIIDKGSLDGLRVGQAVIYQQNAIGKITKVTPSLSEVTLVTAQSSSFAAKTYKDALGVVYGQGNEEMILGNVVLSQTLSQNDLVLTKGDISQNGLGYPPNLIVGKINAINKQPSSLFQSASIKSLINFETLTTVFIVL